MKLPDKVKVAGFDITIEDWPPHQANTRDSFGEFTTYDLVIRIDMSVPRTKILDSFLHEISHVIYWAWKLSDDDKEERYVSAMATAWTQIFRDNPDVLKFIQEAL